MTDHKTGKLHVPYQYCGSAEHQSNACFQVATCSTCKNKNHSPLYICPSLENAVKNQEKDYQGYQSDEHSLGYHKVNYEVKGDIRNVQVSLVVAPS